MTPLGRRVLPIAALLLLLGGIGYVVERNREANAFAVAKAERLQELTRLRKANLGVRAAADPELRVEPLAVEPVPVESPVKDESDSVRTRQAVELIKSGLLGSITWPAMFAEVPNLELSSFSSPPNTLQSSMKNLGKLLGLSDSDSASLQNAITIGEQQFSTAIVASAKVSREGGTVTIEIGDLTSARAAFDRIQQSITDILGPELSGYYEGLGAKSALLEGFNRWGMDGRALRVSRETRTLSNGTQREGITFSRILSADLRGGGAFGGGGSGVTDRASLRVNVGVLESLIPADF